MPGLAAFAKASAAERTRGPARRVPGIDVFSTARKKDVDGRDKPGHDETDVRGDSYFNTTHAGAWSLAPSSPRTFRSTPAFCRRGAKAGLIRR
jgi:hypothetical protein